MHDQENNKTPKGQEDSRRLGYIEKKIDELRYLSNEMSHSFGDLSSHLFGSRKLDATDTGIVGQIQNDIHKLMKGHEDLKNQIVSAEKKQVKYNVQTAIMWVAAGAVVMAIFMLWIQSGKH
jgi:hypothetical protein